MFVKKAESRRPLFFCNHGTEPALQFIWATCGTAMSDTCNFPIGNKVYEQFLQYREAAFRLYESFHTENPTVLDHNFEAHFKSDFKKKKKKTLCHLGSPS